MTDIRINHRTFIFLFIFVVICFVLLLSRDTSHCLSDKENQQVLSAQTNDKLPIIYAVTPTHARPVQKAELTRLSQTLMLVPNVFWVIVEDADSTSQLISSLLKRTKLAERSIQLNAKTPVDYKLTGKDKNWSKPRGVIQRNLALSWIRAQLTSSDTHRHSVVFFMDDDNTYSVEVFAEMARIESGRVGVWPVGLVGGLNVERPLLDAEGVVIGFNSAWRPERPFPIDMAGFAISSELLQRHPEAQFSYDVQRGYQESEFLRHVVQREKLQPLANQCRDVLVWHTRTETPKLDAEIKLQKDGKPSSDDGMEV